MRDLEALLLVIKEAAVPVLTTGEPDQAWRTRRFLRLADRMLEDMHVLQFASEESDRGLTSGRDQGGGQRSGDGAWRSRLVGPVVSRWREGLDDRAPRLAGALDRVRHARVG